ncbi:MAG: hypothetical protein ACOYLE_08240 [Bacteroidales bacterium]
MERYKRVLFIVSAISFSILLEFSSLSCISQNLTTRGSDGMGMTDNYDFYILFLNNEGRITLAMAFPNDTIHIYPYMLHTPNIYEFKAVSGHEFGHYYNYVSHNEVIRTDTLKQNVQIDYIIDSVYWNTPPDLNKIIYKGYDGSSVEKAIIIKNATTMKEGIAAEYAYLEKELGQRGIAWKPMGQYLLPNSRKYYDIIKVKIIETNEIKYICFDITKFFGKF